MSGIRETIGGLWELARLGLFRGALFGGEYWKWRQETAFGSDRSKWPGRLDRWRAVLEYGKWVHRMRRYL